MEKGYCEDEESDGHLGESYDVFELFGNRVFGVLVFKMLFVGFGIWHLCLANSAGKYEGFLSGFLLFVGVVPLLFFRFRRSFGGFRLRLKFLMTASHFIS